MKLFHLVLAVLLLVASPYLFADKDGPGPQKDTVPIPFQMGFDCMSYSGPNCYGDSDSEIPEGMRFVVEYVSARVLVTNGNGFEITFTVGDSNATVRVFKVPAYYSGETVNGSLSIYSISEKVLVFAERTETVQGIQFSVYSTYPNSDPVIHVQHGLITGYLVKIP